MLLYYCGCLSAVAQFIAPLEMAALLIFGFAVWKLIKLSDEYARYFLLFFTLMFLLELAHKLIVLF